MNNLFPDNKDFLYYKSLLRVRGTDAVAEEISDLEAAVYQLVRNARIFMRHVRRVKLVRRVIYRSLPVAAEVLPAYPDKDFHIPNICWTEYIGKKRNDTTDWADIASALNKGEASYDERLLHIHVHLTMLRYHADAKQLVSRLKINYALLRNLELISRSQNIPVTTIVDSINSGTTGTKNSLLVL